MPKVRLIACYEEKIMRFAREFDIRKSRTGKWRCRGLQPRQRLPTDNGQKKE